MEAKLELVWTSCYCRTCPPGLRRYDARVPAGWLGGKRTKSGKLILQCLGCWVQARCAQRRQETRR